MGTSDLRNPNQLGKPICYAEFVMLLQPPPTRREDRKESDSAMRTHVKSVIP